METNYKMLTNLLQKYTPKRHGVCSNKEIELIENELHVKEMDSLQLNNLRDFVVLFFQLKISEHPKEITNYLDKQSAIVYIIDTTILRTLKNEVINDINEEIEKTVLEDKHV